MQLMFYANASHITLKSLNNSPLIYLQNALY